MRQQGCIKIRINLTSTCLEFIPRILCIITKENLQYTYKNFPFLINTFMKLLVLRSLFKYLNKTFEHLPGGSTERPRNANTNITEHLH